MHILKNFKFIISGMHIIYLYENYFNGLTLIILTLLIRR